MITSDLKSLIAKLNPTCRAALEAAAGLCLSHTHYEVDIEHFLIKLLEIPNTDLDRILRHFGVDGSRLLSDLTLAIECFKNGNGRTPSLSPNIPRLFQGAWLSASVDFQASCIRSGHIVFTLVSDREFVDMLKLSSTAFGRIPAEALGTCLIELAAGSCEDAGSRTAGNADVAPGRPASSGTKFLDLYTVNLTEKARSGGIDPVLGRDAEIRQMIDILIRRRQNNPILTGEAGVGKTAVVEGFALRIAEGDVPLPLREVEIRTLDLGLLQAGAGIKGEFENRLKSVIEEVKGSPMPIILFIDEAHTMIGAGGAAGSGDAANLLKPPLARGELRTIAATTWSEYKKYFEKDAALARRFQVVKVEEPDEEKALEMMRGIAPLLEKHHQVMITSGALLDSVRLTRRYLPSRQLPDKAVSVLDTACARVAIGLNTTPPAVEEMTRRIARIEREERLLERESLLGIDHGERSGILADEKAEALARLEKLNARWRKESAISARIMELRASLREPPSGKPADRSVKRLQKELRSAEQKLSLLQENEPLMQIAVDSQTICEVISGWTGIPTGRMLKDEIETVLALNRALGERIIGQEQALTTISRMIRTTHAGIEDPSKPTAVLMFAGPSGVGKTETALALSELLYGGEENVITINMSEYQEAHTVSGLKGSPPGYVGYGEGGVLTEAVRKRPYSVVLLDEVEKAHPDVLELFYQIFDKGTLEDGEGRRIDFKNTLIILTTNLGSDTIMEACAGRDTGPDCESLAGMLRPELLRHFKPAFLGRLKIVPYYPISPEQMRSIVRLKLDRIARRMKESRNVTLNCDEGLIEAIASRCTEVESGARNVDHILSNTLLPEMSRELLSRMASGDSLNEVAVSVGAQGFVYEVK